MTRFGAPKRHRGLARQSEPASARLLRRERVRHAHLDGLAARGFDSPTTSPARSLHACPPRHPRRRARLPVAAVGIDRSMGGHGHVSDPRAGITTMLVSDHPHLFETGGENYHCDFTAWDYVRGHKDDPWRTGRIRHGWAPRRSTHGPRRGVVATTSRARTSATKATSPGRARCKRPSIGCASRSHHRSGTRNRIGSSFSSTSSILMSPSTRRCRGRTGTTTRPSRGRAGPDLAAVRAHARRGRTHGSSRPPSTRELRRQALDDR